MEVQEIELRNNFIWELLTEGDKKKELFEAITDKKALLLYITKSRLEDHFLKFVKRNNFDIQLKKAYLDELTHYDKIRKMRSIVALQRTLDLGEIFQENSIKHAFLKGANFLDESMMGISRPMRDIDVLVDPEDIKRAIKLARTLGFNFQRNIDQYPFLNPKHYDIPTMKDKEGVALEIHYKILRHEKSIQCLLSTKILENKRLVKKSNKELTLHSLETNLIHTIYHGTLKNYFDVGPAFIKDLFVCINNPSLDLKKTLKIAEEVDLKKELESLLILFDSKVPKLKKELTLNIPQEIQSLLKEIILLPVVNAEVNKILSNTPKEKITYFIKLFFVNKEEIYREYQIKNDSYFVYLFYPLRWLRQLRQFFIPLLKGFFSSKGKERAKLIQTYINYLGKNLI